jgi:hypothetical protein
VASRARGEVPLSLSLSMLSRGVPRNRLSRDLRMTHIEQEYSDEKERFCSRITEMDSEMYRL